MILPHFVGVREEEACESHSAFEEDDYGCCLTVRVLVFL